MTTTQRFGSAAMERVRRAAVGAAVALLASVTTLHAQEFIRIGSGTAGTYPILGAKFVEVINANVEGVNASVLAGVGEQSLVRIQQGDAEMSLAPTTLAFTVYSGKGQLGVEATDLRHLMTLHGLHHMAVVQKGAPINSLSDIKGGPYRVWMGPPAAAPYALNVAALGALGTTPGDITAAGGVINTADLSSLQQLFQDGQVDVGFFTGSAPYSMLLQLDSSPGFRILGYSEAEGERYMELLPGAGMRMLPAGLYKSVEAETWTPYIPNQLVVSAKLSDDTVYKITKALIEHAADYASLFPGADSIKPETALAFNKLPVHPGAERYYREAGLLP